MTRRLCYLVIGFIDMTTELLDLVALALENHLARQAKR